MIVSSSHIKKICFIGLVIMTGLSVNVKGLSPVNTVVNQHHLGAWAYKQHGSISNKIEILITDKQLDLYKPDGTKYQYKEIRKNYLEFIKWIDNENYQYYEQDTAYHFFENYYTFTRGGNNVFYLTEKHFIFYMNYNCPVLIVRNDLEHYMNKDELNYLALFNLNGKMATDSMPYKSKLIYDKMKKSVYNESFASQTIVYQTPLLLNSDSCNRYNIPFGWIEHITFINTDPADSTIGKDSVYYYPIPYDTSIVKRYINIAFDINNNVIKISAIGSFFVAIPNSKSYYIDKRTIGYMDFGKIHFLNQTQLDVLNSLLLFKIENRMGADELTNYRNLFQIFVSEEGD